MAAAVACLHVLYNVTARICLTRSAAWLLQPDKGSVFCSFLSDQSVNLALLFQSPGWLSHLILYQSAKFHLSVLKPQLHKVVRKGAGIMRRLPAVMLPSRLANDRVSNPKRLNVKWKIKGGSDSPIQKPFKWWWRLHITLKWIRM